jgi:hypothetical protein
MVMNSLRQVTRRNPTRRRGRKLSIYFETIQTLRRRFWQWLKDQIAQDVQETDGLCEYDCRKQQCTEEEWATCERRIHKASGELWPESSLPLRGRNKRKRKTLTDCLATPRKRSM